MVPALTTSSRGAPRGDAYKTKSHTNIHGGDLSAVARKLPLADDNALVRAKNQFVDIRAVDVLKIHTLYLLSSVVLLLYLIFQEKQRRHLSALHKFLVNNL